MTYELYRYIFIGGTVAAVVMFLITVLLFVFLKIPKVISYLSGRTARKGIEEIGRRAADGSGRIAKPAGHSRARITEPITASGRLGKKERVRSRELYAMRTAKIASHTDAGAPPMEETAMLADETAALAGETVALREQPMEETTVLAGETAAPAEETVPLNEQPMEETAVLHGADENAAFSPAGETMVLSENAPNTDSGIFYVEFEITFVHTGEVIQ